MVRGALGMMNVKSHYRTESLVRLADHLRDAVPQILPFLPEPARQEILAAIDQTASREQQPELKTSLSALRDQAHRAASTAGANN
jgi:hypothetical protein